MMYAEDDLIPVSALQHVLFCARQFALIHQNDFAFTERNRRPPLDEVNALLSFVYTLLVYDVRSAQLL
jgi:CRISPR-associated protein Cas1